MGNGNMTNHLQSTRLGYWGLGICICLVVLFSNCKKEEKVGQTKMPAAGEQETEIQLSRLTGDLLSVQEQIRQQPADVDLRLRLLELAVNQEKRWLRAVGIGLIPTDAPNLSVAMQGAERAAFLDGCRWIAYIMAWNKDARTPEFGQISGQVPPAKIVYKHSDHRQVTVLVETEMN